MKGNERAIEYLHLKYHVEISKLQYNSYDHTFKMDYKDMVNFEGIHYYHNEVNGMVRVPNHIVIHSSSTMPYTKVSFLIKDINIDRNTTAVIEEDMITYMGYHNNKRYYLQVMLPPIQPVIAHTSHSIQYTL